MSALLVVLSVCLFALVASVAVKKQNLIQAAPSMVWFSLMILPFIYQWRFFPADPRASQALGIFLISIALAASDIVSIHSKDRAVQRSTETNVQSSKVLYVLAFLTISIPAFHYWIADSIPIIGQYFGGLTKTEVALKRESFGKLLDLPYAFKVLVNWISNIFGPILIIWLISRKKYFLASGFFLWTLFYAFSSSADGPVIIFLWSLIISITYKCTKFSFLPNLIAVGLIFGLLFTVYSGVMLGDRAIKESNKCFASTDVGFTPGDVLRSCSESNLISINPVIDRVGYRFFLTPVEVSNRWYDYFDGNPSGHRDLSNIFERKISNQASNRVGNWGYVYKFPEKYPETISANSSIDADAYSFAGSFSQFIVALLLLLVRIFIGFSSVNPGNLERVFEALALGQISFFLVTAPLQAILLPQGLVFLLVGLSIIRRKSISRFIFGVRRELG
jgi:hypothetical protein